MGFQMSELEFQIFLLFPPPPIWENVQNLRCKLCTDASIDQFYKVPKSFKSFPIFQIFTDLTIFRSFHISLDSLILYIPLFTYFLCIPSINPFLPLSLSLHNIYFLLYFLLSLFTYTPILYFPMPHIFQIFCINHIHSLFPLFPINFLFPSLSKYSRFNSNFFLFLFPQIPKFHLFPHSTVFHISFIFALLQHSLYPVDSLFYLNS